MIINAYAVLDAFVSLLRLGLAVPIVWLAVRTWKRWRGSAADPIGRHAIEDRFYLLFLLAALLLALNVLAWPLFYLLLQSYVVEWPGVMCIYGVTRVGAGSIGPSRHLPLLLDSLQIGKPAIVFLSGAWFALHLINRRTQAAPLTGRVVLGVLSVALLSCVDAAAELTYLAIPKQEEYLSSGCCTMVFDEEHSPGRFVPPQLLGEQAVFWLSPVYYALNAGLAVALLAGARVCRRRVPFEWLPAIAAAGLVVLLVNGIFLTEIAAPRLLHQPDHHCPYDLVTQAPLGILAAALFVGSSFCVGWACCTGWLGTVREPESAVLSTGLMGRLFRLAAFAAAASVLLLSLLIAAA